MYELTIGEDIKEIAVRADAIAEAKKISTESNRRVLITGDRGREKMTYSKGILEDYQYETRR